MDVTPRTVTLEYFKRLHLPIVHLKPFVPLVHLSVMSFVKLSIFGTSFEVRSFVRVNVSDVDCYEYRWPPDMLISSQSAWVRPPFVAPVSRPDLLHSKGAFGLVWCVFCPFFFWISSLTCASVKFRKGSTYRRICRDKEDHEAIQHPCA